MALPRHECRFPQQPGCSDQSGTDRSNALEHLRLIRPFLEDGVALPTIAANSGVSLRTLRRWVTRYRTHGLSGLIRKPRGDLGQRRSIPHTLEQVIEGLALQKPRRTVANIRREAQRICRDQDWPIPSYSTVRRIVGTLDPALTTLAHEGLKAYQEAYDLIYRHQSLAPNERWQADHSLLPILVRDEAEKPERPWLSVILDDYSRMIIAGQFPAIF
jgi:putative transposase